MTMTTTRKAICHIQLKPGVADPQGVTIKKALENLGYDDVAEVRSGKIFTLTFKDGVNGDLRELTEEICRKLLANPVIETFEVEES